MTWYLQFFFYTMGSTQMGEFDYASWTLHMASIIIFSTLWGFYFREWFGASPKTRRLIFAGIGLLIASTIAIGVGAYIKKDDGAESPGALAPEAGRPGP